MLFSAMMLKSVKYIALSLYLCSTAFAQGKFDTAVIRRNSIRNTPFVMLEIADSFAKRGDSINATAYFLKVNPGSLIYLGFSPDDIDKKLAECKLTNAVRAQYRELFVRAYNKPQTQTADTLEIMFKEDQDTRNKLSKCSDSFSCSTYQKRMMHSDSMHFNWLYNYVQKNGWPTIENGSSFAGIIAMHDGYHHCGYLPYLKKAVLAGDATYQIYNGILNRCLKPPFEQVIKEYKNKAAFDVTYVLKGKKVDAAQLLKMKAFMKTHVPIKHLYFVYESPSRRDYEKFIRSGNSFNYDEKYWVSWELMMILGKYHKEFMGNDEIIPYNYQWNESQLNAQKLKLYLLY